MKTAFLFLSVFLICQIGRAEIVLTDEQYQNMDILHSELKKKDSNFVGLSGSKEKMQVIGISDEEALKVISKVDIKAKRKELKDNDPVIQKNKSGIAKFKAVVPDITDGELEAMGLKVEA